MDATIGYFCQHKSIGVKSHYPLPWNKNRAQNRRLKQMPVISVKAVGSGLVNKQWLFGSKFHWNYPYKNTFVTQYICIFNLFIYQNAHNYFYCCNIWWQYIWKRIFPDFPFQSVKHCLLFGEISAVLNYVWNVSQPNTEWNMLGFFFHEHIARVCCNGYTCSFVC